MTDDTISRAAALTACRNPEYGENCYAYGDDIEKRLMALPPAQPSATDTNVGGMDTISRQAMINEIDLHVGILYDNPTLVESLKLLVRSLPSAQTELENKIRAIGYTGREGRIYIGGRLFAVRELPQ